MNNILDHKFVKASNIMQCENCALSLDEINHHIYPSNDCSEILKISATHKFKKYDKNTTAFCEICGISGIISTNGTVTIERLDFDFYTCNEILMIKANE